MAKPRVYEIAKELSMTSKELLSILAKLGISATSHMSAIEVEDAEKLKKRLSRPEKEKKPRVPPKKKKRKIEVSREIKERERDREKERKRKEFERDTGIIHLTEGVTVKEIAEKLNIKSKEILKKLLMKGVVASINQSVDAETAKELVSDYGLEAEIVSFEKEAALTEDIDEESENLEPRAPVITIMGHVDHGKTLLLDSIRKTHVVEQEAGGITQHIGAYFVDVGDRGITFLDTPGHEAFTMMRARGASITDIVILVVAADDGIMPQTEEAINHARAAEVPLIVAINKIDKSQANPDRVMQQLSERELVPEEWGGDTVCVKVSAKSGEGLDELLDMILLVAEMENFQANPDRTATGTVLESHLESGRGVVATILIHTGTLSVGDPFICGLTSGKVRALFNDAGKPLDKVEPSLPVELLGFSDLPESGDTFQVVTNEREIRKIINHRQEEHRKETLSSSSRLSLNQLFDQISSGEIKELPIILKTDVYGTGEVLAQSLTKLSTDKVKVSIIHSGVGGITESDVLLASASNAIIIGFHVRPEPKASQLAEKNGVEIRVYDVIYEVTKSIEDAMLGLLEPTIKEVYLGRAEVREVFKISKVGTVAGCYVTDGVIKRNANVRLIRNNVVQYDGKLDSLKRFKDDAKEVKQNFECGMTIEAYNDIKVDDIIEAYEKVEVKPKSLR